MESVSPEVLLPSDFSGVPLRSPSLAPEILLSRPHRYDLLLGNPGSSLEFSGRIRRPDLFGPYCLLRDRRLYFNALMVKFRHISLAWDAGRRWPGDSCGCWNWRTLLQIEEPFLRPRHDRLCRGTPSSRLILEGVNPGWSRLVDLL